MKRSYDRSAAHKYLNLRNNNFESKFEDATNFSSAYEPEILDNTSNHEFKLRNFNHCSDNSTFAPAKINGTKNYIPACGNNKTPCDLNNHFDSACYYNRLYNYKFNIEKVTLTSPACFEIEILPNDCEIRIDSTLYSYSGFLITGEVRNHCYTSVPNAVVTLIKCKKIDGKNVNVKLNSVLSDEFGNFQFFVQDKTCQDDYRVILGNSIC